MNPTPPDKLTTENKGRPAEFKVAEIRDDGFAILELGDGRMFPAEVPEGIEVKKHAVVTLKVGDLDKHDVPVDAVVAKVHDK